MAVIVNQLNTGWLLAGMLAAAYLAGHGNDRRNIFAVAASLFGVASIILSVFLISFQM